MIIIVGCGGTGSNLAPMLSRMMLRDVFVLIDGDVVEHRNVERQTYQEFDVGMNKARALAKKLNSNFQNMHYFVDKYIESSDEIIEIVDKYKEMYSIDRAYGNDYLNDENRFTERILSQILIIGAVDNNDTRKILEESYLKLSKLGLNPIYYIDSGNESTYGTILVADETPNKILRSELFGFETSNDHPTKKCAHEILNGDEQQYQINLDMALAIAKVIHAIKNKKEYPHAITIDGFDRYSTF